MSKFIAKKVPLEEVIVVPTHTYSLELSGLTDGELEILYQLGNWHYSIAKHFIGAINPLLYKPFPFTETELSSFCEKFYDAIRDVRNR